MSKSRLWIILILILITIILISWKLILPISNKISIVTNYHEPTYTSSYLNTLFYSSTGSLAYELVSDKLFYFASNSLSWFNKPIMTVYDINKKPVWLISADKAKLTKYRILYLYGHVQLNTLTENSRLKYVKTDNAKINLTTQEIFSEDQVTLCGQFFYSTSMKMQVNLREKNAKLIEKVHSFYEVQNRKK